MHVEELPDGVHDLRPVEAVAGTMDDPELHFNADFRGGETD